MKKQKIQFAIFMLLLAVTACDNADYSKSAPFDNGVYLSVAESKTSETMTSVSYTHLDVYKRQIYSRSNRKGKKFFTFFLFVDDANTLLCTK